MSDTITKLKQRYAAFMNARDELLDAGAERAKELGFENTLVEIWPVILRECCGKDAEKIAYDLKAGIEEFAEDLLRK